MSIINDSALFVNSIVEFVTAHPGYSIREICRRIDIPSMTGWRLIRKMAKEGTLHIRSDRPHRSGGFCSAVHLSYQARYTDTQGDTQNRKVLRLPAPKAAPVAALRTDTEMVHRTDSEPVQNTLFESPVTRIGSPSQPKPVAKKPQVPIHTESSPSPPKQKRQQQGSLPESDQAEEKDVVVFSGDEEKQIEGIIRMFPERPDGAFARRLFRSWIDGIGKHPDQPSVTLDAIAEIVEKAVESGTKHIGYFRGSASTGYSFWSIWNAFCETSRRREAKSEAEEDRAYESRLYHQERNARLSAEWGFDSDGSDGTPDAVAKDRLTQIQRECFSK